MFGFGQPNAVYSQVTELHYDHIGAVDGLTGQISRLLAEDDFGNIWIGSFDEPTDFL